jgi:hypothetical protein
VPDPAVTVEPVPMVVAFVTELTIGPVGPPVRISMLN